MAAKKPTDQNEAGEQVQEPEATEPQVSAAEPEQAAEPEASTEGDVPDTLVQDVKTYLRDPSRVKPPAAVINFGADRPIRPSKE